MLFIFIAKFDLLNKKGGINKNMKPLALIIYCYDNKNI